MKTKKSSKNAFILMSVIAILVIGGTLLYNQEQNKQEVALSAVATNIQQGLVEKIEIQGTSITVTNTDGVQQESRKETGIDITDSLTNLGVTTEQLGGISLEYKQRSTWSSVWPVLLSILPPILLIGLLLWFMLRGAQRGTNQAFNFGKARAKMFGGLQGKRQSVTFKDIAGEEEAIEELKEIVEFLKTPKKFIAMGAKIPRGVMLMGPPGTR